jgi:protein phosphatase
MTLPKTAQGLNRTTLKLTSDSCSNISTDGSRPLFNVGQATHPGLAREENEDSFGWFSTKAGELLLVADGMGGHSGGETAGKTSVEAFQQYVTSSQDEPPRLLENALLEADRQVTLKAYDNPALAGMGSTLVALLLSGYTAWIVHIGDSRIYRLKDGVLELLTKDHSFIQEMVDSGQMTPSQAKLSEQRHVITQSLGGNLDPNEIHVKKINCHPGDLFLLCTDGLTEPVREDKIKSILASSSSIQAKAKNLIEQALKAGGPDNVTVQLAQLDRTSPLTVNYFTSPLKPRRRRLIIMLIFLFGLVVGALSIYFWQKLPSSLEIDPQAPLTNQNSPVHEKEDPLSHDSNSLDNQTLDESDSSHEEIIIPQKSLTPPAPPDNETTDASK